MALAQGLPLVSRDIALVEVEVLGVAGKISLRGVLVDDGGFPRTKTTARKPGVLLVAVHRGIVGVLGHPQRMIGGNLAPILVLHDRAIGVHNAAHPGTLEHTVEELFGVVGAKSAVALVIPDGEAVAKVVGGVVNEPVSLLNRVATTREMIEAPGLALPNTLLHPGVTGVLDDGSSLGGLDNHKVSGNLLEVKSSLVAGNVDTVHHDESLLVYFLQVVGKQLGQCRVYCTQIFHNADTLHHAQIRCCDCNQRQPFW